VAAVSKVFDWGIAPLVLVALAFEPNFRHGVLNFNESGQHLVAMHELANGSALFRDVFAQYGPLHYYVPTALGRVFGESIATLRGYFMAGEIAGLLAAWALCRALIPRRGFAFAAAVVIVMEAHHPFWSTRWGGFRFAFVYLSLLGLWLGLVRPRSWWLVFAGASAGLAFLHTYDAGAAAGVGAIGFFVHSWLSRAEGRVPLREAGRYAVGVAAVLLPFVLHLLATGTFGDYLDQLPFLNPGRAFAQPIPISALTLTVLAPAFVYLGTVGFIAHGLRREVFEREGGVAILLVVASGALLYLSAFRAIRGPQFEMSLPLVIVALFFLADHAYGVFERGLDIAGDRIGGWLAFGFVFVVMLALTFGEIRTYQGGMAKFLAHQRQKAGQVAKHIGANPLEQYRELALPGGGGARLPERQVAEIEEITAFLAEQTRPFETMLAYPDLGAYNFFVDRPLASRFPIAVLAAADVAWSDELLDVVRNRRADIVLVGRQLGTLARATGRREEFLPRFRTIVEENYLLVRRFEQLDVYRAVGTGRSQEPR
jgi:hypothetical protein